MTEIEILKKALHEAHDTWSGDRYRMITSGLSPSKESDDVFYRTAPQNLKLK